jgi:myo-inositol-1-phosphate synthase
MLEQTRLASKKVSKTEAVQSQLDQRLEDENIHIGPSDYVPWQNDNKVCFLRMEWRGFGDVPMNLEARLSVEDSPNSAGVVIDAIRCAKLALDRKIGGPLDAASACMMKHPRKQMRDSEAFVALERFIDEEIVPVDVGVSAVAGNGNGTAAVVSPTREFLAAQTGK